MTLKGGGYILLKATDGQQALDMAIGQGPDLIIMDMQLPKVSGLDVTRKLRRMPEFKSTPIIALTAYAMKGDRANFMEAGCDAYVSKPINTRELPHIISRMLGGRHE